MRKRLENDIVIMVYNAVINYGGDIVKEHIRYKRSVRLCASFCLIFALTMIYTWLWYRRISPLSGAFYAHRGNWVIIGMHILLIILFDMMYGGFRLGDLERGNVIYSQMLSCSIVIVITYFQLALITFHFPPIYMFIELWIAYGIVIVAWALGYSMIYYRMFPPRKLLVICGEHADTSLVQKMQMRKDRYCISEVEMLTNWQEQDTELLLDKIKNYDGVVLCNIPEQNKKFLIEMCFMHSVRVYMIPSIEDILIRGARELHEFDTPVLLSRANGLPPEQQLAKRCMDLMVSFLMLVAASPLMAIAALAIKLYDGGDVIYKQLRLTEGGRTFYVYKFRSMRMDAEKDGVARLASEHDDRITPVGKIIRMTRMDELPQILNVLRGDMSLVGPRPERPELAAEIEKTLPQFRSRLKVKAGLTGYAQIYGKYNTTPEDKLKLDLCYIQNYSLFLDLKLILMTVKILFMKESTEGVADPVKEQKDGGHL